MKIKNIIKVQAAAAIAVVAALCCTSCNDDWNEHYDAGSVDSGTLWSAISAQSNVSNFANVVKACGYDAVLNGSQTFSVFAPTNDVFSSAQADSLIAVFNAQKAAGVKSDDNTVVRQFLQNHIALYNHPVSSLSNDSVTMMNGKYEVLTPNAIGSSNLLTTNALYSNGVLFTVGKQISYFPNVYEYLGLDAQTDSVYQFLTSFNKYEINESKSVPGDIVDGHTVYLDSVMNVSNVLFNQLGLLNSEDSTYWMIAPTNAEWTRMVEEYTPYFNYDAKVKQRDSLQFVNSRLAILGGTVFSRTINPDEAFRDSAVSTSANSYMVRRMLDLDPYYVYYRPFDNGGVFSGTESVVCSNGEVRKAANFGVSKFKSFMQTIKVEAESVRNQDSIVYAVDPLTVREVTTDNPFYDKVSGNSFVEIIPETAGSRPEVYFSIPGVMANIPYDVYAVFVPVLAYDTLAVEEATRPNLIRSSFWYNDKNGAGASTKFMGAQPTDPSKVDTLLLAKDFVFPTCSYGLTDPQVRVQLISRVSASQTATHTNTIRLDCIILKPHDVEATNDQDEN